MNLILIRSFKYNLFYSISHFLVYYFAFFRFQVIKFIPDLNALDKLSFATEYDSIFDLDKYAKTVDNLWTGNFRRESKSFPCVGVGRILHNVRYCISQLTNIILLNLYINIYIYIYIYRLTIPVIQTRKLGQL